MFTQKFAENSRIFQIFLLNIPSKIRKFLNFEVNLFYYTPFLIFFSFSLPRDYTYFFLQLEPQNL